MCDDSVRKAIRAKGSGLWPQECGLETDGIVAILTGALKNYRRTACTKEAESKEQADDVQSRFSGLWINASDKKEGIPCEQEEPSHIRCL